MRSRTLFALVTVCLLLLAACSDDGGGGASSPAAGGGETTEPTEGGEDTSGDATVATAESDLGEILVDADGSTLYVFLPDEGGESTCYDDCEAAWPPLTIDGDPAAGDGADDSLLGTTERDDGSTQVTYDGWPLYYYSADAAPGDTNGQGVGDVWFVVGPDGAAIDDAQALVDDKGGAAAKY